MSIETDFGAETTTTPTTPTCATSTKLSCGRKTISASSAAARHGNRIDAARAVFNVAVKRRPRGRYTIRQRCRVVEQWPNLNAD
jgi:hypothetical protein